MRPVRGAAVRDILLNAGAQEDFVHNDHRSSAFIGGLGSGKTFAGIARALLFAQQPQVAGSIYGARGVIAAVNFPVLKRVILPQFFEMMDGAGLWRNGTQENSYIKSEKMALLKNGAEIYFVSLDQPNWMRGVELSWFFIDEGRHVDGEAWKILSGRLRQKGYRLGGWVCSTPNGYDWMWRNFHPDSKKRVQDATWYGSPTTQNVANLPESYIPALMAEYEGRFLRQEVYGEFVGVVEGGVFFAFDPSRHVKSLEYDESLPLYSFWDFGLGDENVVLFCQVTWKERVEGGIKFYTATPHFIDELAQAELTSREWAMKFKDHCRRAYGGHVPEVNIGDPAGLQRNQVTKTSVIEDLAQHGVKIRPAPKKALDYAFRIMNNLMEGDRWEVDSERCTNLAGALASYKWHIKDGARIGTVPVHDWTSHYADAARYGVQTLLSLGVKRVAQEMPAKYEPTQYGYIDERLRAGANEDFEWLGQGKPAIDWTPAILGPVKESA